MTRISLKKIAEEVGVNPSTVSRVLRNDTSCYISAENKKKILDICKKYNYSPNVTARNLALGKTFNVAFVANEFSNFESFGPFLWASIAGIHEVLNQAGYLCSVSIMKNIDDIEKIISSRTCDGLIFGNGVINKEILYCLKSASLPYVFMEDCNTFIINENRVLVNERSGAEALIEHLLALGHKNIAVYGMGPHIELYKNIFHNYGLLFDTSNVFTIPSTDIYNLSIASYIHSDTFIKKHGSFTAVCCTNDLVALGLCKRFLQEGIVVGKDISVTGIDNWEQMLSYPDNERFMTTIDYCRTDIGRETARLLLDVIQEPLHQRIGREVNTKLVIRTSVGHV